MSLKAIVEGICGLVAAYVGVRFIPARKVPIVFEGGVEPIGWLKGWEASLAGVVVVAAGVWLIAAAIGLVSKP